MFYSDANLSILSKQLALSTKHRIDELSLAVTLDYQGECPPVIIGSVLGVIPHLYEKAIITNPTFAVDISVKLNLLFQEDFKAILRMQTNAGGFSNPLKKVFFNSVFSKMFDREFAFLKPKFDEFWYVAREQKASPFDLFAIIIIKYCESSANLKLETDEVLHRTSREIQVLFDEIYTFVRNA